MVVSSLSRAQNAPSALNGIVPDNNYFLLSCAHIFLGFVLHNNHSPKSLQLPTVCPSVFNLLNTIDECLRPAALQIDNMHVHFCMHSCKSLHSIFFLQIVNVSTHKITFSCLQTYYIEYFSFY